MFLRIEKNYLLHKNYDWWEDKWNIFIELLACEIWEKINLSLFFLVNILGGSILRTFIVIVLVI